MARFNELIDSVGLSDDGITPSYPDTFMTDIAAAYSEDIAAISEPANAKIDVLEADLMAANEEIARLKAHNYDLIMQIPATDTSENNSEDSAPSDSVEDDGGVETLIKKDESN